MPDMGVLHAHITVRLSWPRRLAIKAICKAGIAAVTLGADPERVLRWVERWCWKTMQGRVEEKIEHPSGRESLPTAIDSEA